MDSAGMDTTSESSLTDGHCADEVLYSGIQLYARSSDH